MFGVRVCHWGGGNGRRVVAALFGPACANCGRAILWCKDDARWQHCYGGTCTRCPELTMGANYVRGWDWGDMPKATPPGGDTFTREFPIT